MKIPGTNVTNVLDKLGKDNYIVGEVVQWEYSTYIFKKLEVKDVRGMQIVSHQGEEYKIKPPLATAIMLRLNWLYTKYKEQIKVEFRDKTVTVAWTMKG